MSIGAAVVLLDGDRVARKLLRLGVGDRKAIADPLRSTGTVTRRLACLLRIGEPHSRRLAADGLAQDRRPARGEARLVDVELVGVDRTLHDRLAQAIRRGDEHHLVEARLGVEREHHARGAEIAAHHPLHPGRQRDIRVGESLVDAIGDGAIVVEAGKYLLYRMKIYSLSH